MTREFVVGIPTLNRYDLLEKCLQHIFAGTSKPQTVYIVDNGRRLPQGTFADGMPINVIVPQCNLGVSASWNVLLRLAGKLPMVLVNDDVFVSENTLEELMKPDEMCIVTGLGWALFRQDPGVRLEVGDYDENFFPAYYEDNDFDRRRHLANVTRVIKENDVVVGHGADLGKPHTPSSTLKHMTPEERRDLQERHHRQTQYYIAKWGGLPGHECYKTPFEGLSPEALAVIREQWSLPERLGIPRILR